MLPRNSLQCLRTLFPNLFLGQPTRSSVWACSYPGVRLCGGQWSTSLQERLAKAEAPDRWEEEEPGTKTGFKQQVLSCCMCLGDIQAILKLKSKGCWRPPGLKEEDFKGRRGASFKMRLPSSQRVREEERNRGNWLSFTSLTLSAGRRWAALGLTDDLVAFFFLAPAA